MPNVAFHHEVLTRVLKSPSPPPLPAGANQKFVELGAIGPDIYQYTPVSTALAKALDKVFQTALTTSSAPDLSPITSVAVLNNELQNRPMMAIYSLFCQEIVLQFWKDFHDEAALLTKLQPIGAAQDGNALKALGGLDILDKAAKDLLKLAASSKLLMQIVPLILEIVPPIQEPPSNPAAKPWDPSTCRPAEFLRWHHTNLLTQNLVSSATTPEQKSYAYGYQCHIASAVAGEPFINNIVGGPYRTHWWRNRLVSNFVDSWTFGRYEPPVGSNPQASMAGDTPTPAYPSWPDITTSNLQNNFDVAGFAPAADLIPEAVRRVGIGLDDGDTFLGFNPATKKVLDYIHSAITNTYPHTVPPSRPPDFDTDPLPKALAGLYGVVWIMTSGFTTPPVLPPLPSSCDGVNTPTWVTSPGAPPTPKKGGPSTGATVCGVLLAILAALAFLAGDFAAGAGAVAGAIAEFLSGHGIDWDAFNCDIFWLTKTLIGMQSSLFLSMAEGGLGYPVPSRLGNNAGGSWQPVSPAQLSLGTDPTPLTKLNGRVGNVAADAYPFQMDQTSPAGTSFTADNFYQAYPAITAGDTTQVEQPPVPNFPPTATVPPSTDFKVTTLYPELVVDHSPAPPASKGLLTPVPFPSDYKYGGDAVSNAILFLKNGPANLPNYNLDGDRGYRWLNWNPQAPKLPFKLHPGNYPSSGTVIPIEE